MNSVSVLCVVGVALLCCLSQETNGLAVMSIDFGSQFMKIALVKPGVPMEIVLNKESRRKTPIAVSLRNGERLFGENALSVAVKFPKSSYIFLQDLLGKSFDNPLVQQYKERFPWYDLVKDKETGMVRFQHDSETTFSPEELLGMLFNHSRTVVEDFADQPVKDLVITVPAFFNQAERRAVMRAAELVGLNVLQLMNDNTAVALNYGVFRRSSFNSTEKHIMFYDMGASSTVATIVGYSTTKTKERGITETVPQLVVKGVGFDRTLGGHPMEIRLRNHLIKLFTEQHKLNGKVTDSPRAMAKFLKEALRVKQVLSANSDIYAQIEGAFEEKDFRAKVSRTEFEDMCKDILDRVPAPVEEALKSAAMRPSDIESVILVGGGTRVPKVQETLLETVQKSELGKSLNTDEAAAMGAVYQAAKLGKGFRVKKFLIKDANIYPIQVAFERRLKEEGGEESVKHVKRNLYHRLNVVPQKKVMTFNRHVKDFKFYVSYNNLEFMSEKRLSMFGALNLTTVNVQGVAAALSKHEKGESKGVKAYFRMDESGILHLDKIESVFETVEEKKDDQSTFAKIGSKISSFFTGSSEDKEGKVESQEEEKPEEGKEEKEENQEDSKQDDKAEKKDDGKKAEEKPQEEAKESEKKEEEKKKEDEAKKEEKQESKEKEPEKEPEAKDGGSDKKAGDAGSKGNETKKEEEKKPPKPVTVREALEMSIEMVDIPDPTKEQLTAAKKILTDLQAHDDAKIAKEEARNSLESYIFEMKEKMYEEVGELVTTEEEREKMEEKLSEFSEWLDEEGWDASVDIYKDKFSKIKKFTADFVTRMEEHKARPQALTALRSSLNLTSTFLKQLANLTDKNEIYTVKDLEDAEKLYNETEDWLYKMEKKQNQTKPYEKPALLVKDIASKQGRVDRELMYLISKAKYYVPKPKVNETADASKKASNETKSNTSEKKKSKQTADKAEKVEKKDEKSEEKAAKKKPEPEQKDSDKPKGREDEDPLAPPAQKKKKTSSDADDSKSKNSDSGRKPDDEL